MTNAYDKLHQRIAEKKIDIAQHEAAMKLHLHDIREQLTPGKLLKSAVKNVVTEVRTAPPTDLIKTGLNMGATFLADRFLFRKKGFLIRTVGMFAVRKLVNKFTRKKDENAE